MERTDGSVADDQFHRQPIVEQVVSRRDREFPSTTEFAVLRELGFRTDGQRDQVVAGDTAGAEIDQAITFAQRRGQTTIALLT